MALCEYNLTSNIENSCKIVGGLKEIGYIANKGDITGAPETNNTFNAFSFAEDKFMYKIYTPTKTPFTGSNTALEESDVVNRFTNTVSFVILENDDPTSSIINNLANGKFVVVIENEYQNEKKDNAFSVYGMERGLRATEITRDPYDDASAGGWTVTMQETGAAVAEHFFFDTDYETTVATLDGYVQPTGSGN